MQNHANYNENSITIHGEHQIHQNNYKKNYQEIFNIAQRGKRDGKQNQSRIRYFRIACHRLR